MTAPPLFHSAIYIEWLIYYYFLFFLFFSFPFHFFSLFSFPFPFFSLFLTSHPLPTFLPIDGNNDIMKNYVEEPMLLFKQV